MIDPAISKHAQAMISTLHKDLQAAREENARLRDLVGVALSFLDETPRSLSLHGLRGAIEVLKKALAEPGAGAAS